VTIRQYNNNNVHHIGNKNARLFCLFVEHICSCVYWKYTHQSVIPSRILSPMDHLHIAHSDMHHVISGIHFLIHLTRLVLSTLLSPHFTRDCSVLHHHCIHHLPVICTSTSFDTLTFISVFSTNLSRHTLLMPSQCDWLLPTRSLFLRFLMLSSLWFSFSCFFNL